jgi:molybdopterin/thiamine biosynthesis adenylyltransferase
MGLQRFVLIDFDRVESHNRDRLVVATGADIGRLKVEVAEERIRAAATAAGIEVRGVPFSVVEEEGYRAALDCDVLFSCVDRPRPRSVIDHFAFAHLIPAIDGGIQVRFKHGRFSGVDWQLQTVGPGRACLECLGAYNPADVSTEVAGKLDDPSYLAGLPADHRFKQNENVFPFAANLASLEVMQLIALVTGAAGITDFGVQRFRYVPGILEQQGAGQCLQGCDRSELLGQGDRHFTLVGSDLAAVASRQPGG